MVGGEVGDSSGGEQVGGFEIFEGNIGVVPAGVLDQDHTQYDFFSIGSAFVLGTPLWPIVYRVAILGQERLVEGEEIG